jgi:hypothetical protein
MERNREWPGTAAPPVRHVTGVAPPLSDEQIGEESTVTLARTLVERLTLLAKKEIELAREEARVDVKRGIAAGSLAGVSGVALIIALVCAVVCAILAIGRVFPPVWVAFIGAGLFAVLGVGLAMVTAAETRELKPERTMRQARQTIEMLREPVRS